MSKRSSQTRGTSDEGQAKKVKIHPFFTKPGVKDAGSSSGPLVWLPALGKKKTCLHAINLSPKANQKVALFDFDGTLVKFEGSGKGKESSIEWHWWHSAVPDKLKKVHAQGYSIIIVTNQNIKAGRIPAWKEKVEAVAKQLSEVPFRIFAATEKDGFRKPMIGMWSELARIFAEEGVTIDKSSSFFVGDAAGRIFHGKTPADFAGTDRKWALNVGVEFHTPEEYFLGQAKHANWRLEGFHPSSVPNLPLFLPSSSPLVHSPPPKQELVLFVGYPGLGKTTLFRTYFEPSGYVHINQDTLGTRQKCVKRAAEILDEGGRCVIDNTNRDKFTRKFYIDLAKKKGVPIRCCWFTGSMQLAWHNNLYRAYNLPPAVAAREQARDPLPYLAMIGYRDAFEEPTLDEGLTEIKRINWVFEGSEEEKRYWSMWLQTNGK